MADASPNQTSEQARETPPPDRRRWHGLRNKLHARRERIRARPALNTT